MSNRKSSGKRFITLGPYQDLPEEHFFTPKKMDLKVVPSRHNSYDNPNFRSSPSELYRSDQSLALDKQHVRKVRRKRYCIAAIAIFLLVLLITTALAVAIYFIDNQMTDNGAVIARPPPTKSQSSLASDPDFVANLKIVNYNWDPRMADKESDEFRNTATQIENQLDEAFKNSPIGPVYNYSVVHSLSEGSVDVNYTIHLMQSVSTPEEQLKIEELKNTPNIIKQAIKEGLESVKKQKAEAGQTTQDILEVDTTFTEVVVVTTPPTTTPTTTPTTPPTITPTTATAPTSTSTTTTEPTTSTPSTTSIPTSTSSRPTVAKESPTTTTRTKTTTTISTSTTTTSTTWTVDPNKATTTSKTTTTARTETTTDTTIPQGKLTTLTTAEQQTENATTVATPIPTAAANTSGDSCPSWSNIETILSEKCADVIKVINQSETTEKKCMHFESLLKCSTYVLNVYKWNCTINTLYGYYKQQPSIGWLNLNPNSCSDVNATYVPFHSPCRDVDALKYLVTYACDVEATPEDGACAPMQKASPCINSSLASLGLQCQYVEILTGVDQNLDLLFGSAAPACNQLKEKLINGSCYGMTSKNYIPDMTTCFTPIRKLRPTTNPQPSLCRLFVESVRCLERRSGDESKCSADDISLTLLEQINMLLGYGAYGLAAVSSFYGDIKRSVQLLNCRGYVKSIATIPELCDDNDLLADTIVSEICMLQTKQGRSDCGVTASSLVKCAWNISRTFGANCTEEGIITAINSRSDLVKNITANDTTSICDSETFCAGVVTRHDDILMCLNFMEKLDYSVLNLTDVCLLYGEGLKCMGRYLANQGLRCSPPSISPVVANMLLNYNLSQFDFNVCKAQLPGPSSVNVPLCKNNYTMLKYIQAACLQSGDIPPNPNKEMTCQFMNSVVDCAVKGLTPSMIYCSRRDVAQLLVNNTAVISSLYPQINLTNCPIPDEVPCSDAVTKNNEMLGCLTFMGSLNYTVLNQTDICLLYGGGLTCMSRYLSYRGIQCSPNSLSTEVANTLLKNNLTPMNFSVCDDQLTKPSNANITICNDDYVMLKYIQSACLKSAPIPPNPNKQMTCQFMYYVVDCAITSLQPSMIYCSVNDVAQILINNAPAITAMYPQLNFTNCQTEGNTTMPPMTTPSYTTTCTWEQITSLAGQYCEDIISAFNTTTRDKCSLYSELIQCSHIVTQVRWLRCSVAKINQLALDNQPFMMAMFGFDAKSCQGYQGDVLSTVRDINGTDVCNSSVVHDYLTSSTCGYLNPRNSSQPCSTVVPFMTCMAASLSDLTNERCSNIHPLNLIKSDINLQNIVSACDKRYEDILNNSCLDTNTIMTLSPQIFGPCLAPLVYLQNTTSSTCRIYAHSLNCMRKRLGANCTLSTLHSHLSVYTDMASQYTSQQPYTPQQKYTTQQPYSSQQKYTTQQPYNSQQSYTTQEPYNQNSPSPSIQLPGLQSSLLNMVLQYTTQQAYNQNSSSPNIQLSDQQSSIQNMASITKQCTDYIVSENATSLPPICEDSEALIAIAMPCVSAIYKSVAQFNITTSCFVLLPGVQMCFESILRSLGESCSPQTVFNLLTDNKYIITQYFPNMDLAPCLANGTIQGICPALTDTPTITTTTGAPSSLDNAYVCLSVVFTSLMSPLQQDHVCSVYSAALKCVIAKSELKGYNTTCNENNIFPILTAALSILPTSNITNTSVTKCQGSGPSTKPICKDTRVLAILAVSQPCPLYLSFSQSRPGGLCGGLIECVGVKLSSSGMYCRSDEIGVALVKESLLLQQYNITLNPSECTTNRTLPSYPTSNISECVNVLQSDINPVLYCNHSLIAINKTNDKTEQCRILPDLLQCLVIATHYNGYNCTVDQLFTLYRANNSLITQFVPKFDPLACTGATEIQVTSPRGGNLCAEPPVYPYLEKYACASYKNHTSSCKRMYNLTGCMQTVFKSFDTYCTPEVTLTMIQSLPSMMYVGNFKACNFSTPETGPGFASCRGLTPSSHYFTECSSNYSKILTVQGEQRCPYWADTVRCVQSNKFWNNEYCSTQAVIETLSRHPELSSVLPGFSPDTCKEDIYLAEPCKDLNLYQLTLIKCRPRSKMCGQQSLIRSCVERELRNLGQYCSEEDITNQLRTFETNSYRKCVENDIVLDNERRVLIYQNGKNHTICGYGWDDNDARVACRQMGFKEGQAHSVYSYNYERAYYSYSCTGSENQLSNCSRYYSSNCSSSYAAGAICHNDEYEFSLVGGESGNYGWVVIKVNNVKGYLCSSSYFSDQEANSLCMHLNFAGGELYQRPVPQTAMTTVWRNAVNCPTSYTPFPACLKDNFGLKPATTNSSLVCNYYPQVYCYGSIRLNTQYKNRTGLVQMYKPVYGKPTLYSVCRDNVNNQTVGAVCKQIGFNNGGYLIPYNPFKTTIINIGVRINSCTNHDDLGSCDIKVKTSEYDIINCNSGPAVITCNTNSSDEIADNTIRMESYDGRLLVYKYGLWGRICYEGWNNTAASVYCKGQGYDSGLAKGVNYNYNIDIKWWFNVRCHGNETSLKDCQYDLEDKNNNCSSYKNDAAVFCFTKADAPRLSLHGGNSSDSGLVFVNIRGKEGPLCTNYAYNIPPVICRDQGYTDGGVYYTDFQLPKHDGSWRADIYCSGSETLIDMCRKDGNWTWIPNDASVPSEISCGRELMHQVFCYGEVRLNTGFHNKSGLIQMINNEQKWEVFCPGQLNPEAYNVICRQLNLSNQGHELPINFPGYAQNVNKQYLCVGNESKLSECSSTLKSAFCRIPIAIVCQDNFKVADELQDVMIQPDGRVLIKKYDVWGSVCNDMWNQTETDVLCRSRGFVGGITKEPKYSVDTRPLFTAMKCLGSETNLRDCDSRRMGNTTMSSCYRDVAVRCLNPNDNFELSIEGGSSSGRLIVTRANKTAYLCDPEYFSPNDAIIVCQHLGYDDGERGQYYSGDDTILKEAWEIRFDCPSWKEDGPRNLQTCLEGEWSLESWWNGFSNCQYNSARVTCKGQASSGNKTSLCSNIKNFEMLDKDCDDVIDNIARAVQISQLSACQYFPSLVRCLSEKMISRNIICTESDIFTVLRQNRGDIMNITGGLNTDYCDGMTWQPSTGTSNSTGCASLSLMSRVLPLCYQTPNKTISDPIQIQQLCSQGEMFMNCLVRELKTSSNTSCRVEDIGQFFAMNPKFVMEKIKFDLSKCSSQAENTTSGYPGSTNSTTGSRIDRCSNATYFEMVVKDCDDVIDNITSAVKISQMSACQYFPSLVSCLSEKMISRNIICTESDIFTVLRQNKDDIMNITGGLNTDACDGMTWQPSTGCTSLPLMSRVLPQCYTTPNTTITDPNQIQQLCSQGEMFMNCLVGALTDSGNIVCKVEDIGQFFAMNPTFVMEKLKFDLSQCSIQAKNTTSGNPDIVNPVTGARIDRCSNATNFEMVDKDCDDVIDNITRAVKVSQMSACQYFPSLVSCLSEKMINRNIICTESDIFTVLRQNKDDIMNITGGLNTDACDGMTWQPSTGCTSLPLISRVLPQCYTTPNTAITDPSIIPQLCSQAPSVIQCLQGELLKLDITCSLDISLVIQNQQWFTDRFGFDISVCFKQAA